MAQRVRSNQGDRTSILKSTGFLSATGTSNIIIQPMSHAVDSLKAGDKYYDQYKKFLRAQRDDDDEDGGDRAEEKIMNLMKIDLKKKTEEYDRNYRTSARPDISIGNKILAPFQYSIAMHFMNSTGISLLKSMRGTGKTVAAAFISSKYPMSLVVAPKKNILESWVRSLTEMDILDTKFPSRSEFIIYKGGILSHDKYIGQIMDGTIKPTKLRVVTKQGSLDKGTGKSTKNVHSILDVFRKVKAYAKTDELTVIVDEAHLKIPKLIAKLQPLLLETDPDELKVKRELLMSGSDIDLSRIGFYAASCRGCKVKQLIHNSYLPKLPQETWAIAVIEDENVGPAIAHILKTDRKILVISDQSEFESYRIKEAANSVGIPYREVGSTAMTDIDSGDSVLVHSSKQGAIGLNVRSKSLIIISPGKSAEPIIQGIGRIIRPDSPYLETGVNIYMICLNMTDYLISYYAKAFTSPHWMYGYKEEADTGMVHKAVAFINAISGGHDAITRYSKEDLCILFADYPWLVTKGYVSHGSELRNDIISWWKRNKANGLRSELTEPMILDLVFWSS